MKLPIPALFFSIFILGGCSSSLHVRDINSNIVYGANAEVTRFSLASDPIVEADRTGVISIPWGLPGIEMVVVRKQGYRPAVISSNQLGQKPWVAVLVPNTKNDNRNENKNGDQIWSP